MVRTRNIVHVRYGHAAEVLKVLEQMNEVSRARGWSEATFWINIAGPFNEFIAEADHPDLATFEQVGAARMADAEWMKLLRSSVEHIIEGTLRNEILMTPSPPAG